MEYRQLGRTDLKVSSICLGTMTWGQQNTETEGHDQMDYALDRGINFFDTAELYSIPPKAETKGSTETIIGSWFNERKNRDKVILATKVVGRSSMDWFRKDGLATEVSPKQIREAVEGSLKRLQTDYIDLYQIHWPDRPMRIFEGLGFEPYEGNTIPMAECLNTMAELVKEGKIRYVGLSNETPWGVMQFLKLSENHNLPRVHSIQNAYNLLNRSFEIGLSEVTYHEQVGLLAYSPLAQGFLSGKYENEQTPQNARQTLFGRMERYHTAGASDAITKYVKLAKDSGLDPAQMALQFVTTRPFVTSNIIGATTMEQLKTDIDSINVKLSDEVIKAIEYVHLLHSNPCP